jgi:hypothetical protein
MIKKSQPGHPAPPGKPCLTARCCLTTSYHAFDSASQMNPGSSRCSQEDTILSFRYGLEVKSATYIGRSRTRRGGGLLVGGAQIVWNGHGRNHAHCAHLAARKPVSGIVGPAPHLPALDTSSFMGNLHSGPRYWEFGIWRIGSDSDATRQLCTPDRTEDAQMKATCHLCMHQSTHQTPAN